MLDLKFEQVSNNDDVDIAIIGAGITGLYSAYRLLTTKAFAGKKIAIYERLNRTGGRLQTDLIPIRHDHKTNSKTTPKSFFDSADIDLVKEEQGGMRFNYGMEELMSLIAIERKSENLLEHKCRQHQRQRRKVYFGVDQST